MMPPWDFSDRMNDKEWSAYHQMFNTSNPEPISKFYEHLGPIVTPRLLHTWVTSLLTEEMAPYPLEAYVASCVEYLSDFSPKDQLTLIEPSLSDHNYVLGTLVKLALNLELDEKPLQLLTDNNYIPPKRWASTQSQLELAMDLWTQHHPALDFLDTQWPEELTWLTGASWKDARLLSRLSQSEKEELASKLKAEVPRLCRAIEDDSEVDVFSPEIAFRPLLKEKPALAKAILVPLFESIANARSGPTSKLGDLCERYRLSLSDKTISRLVLQIAHATGPVNEARTGIKSLILSSANSTMLADKLFDLLPTSVLSSVAPFLSKSKVETILSDPDPAALRKKPLVYSPHVQENISLAHAYAANGAPFRAAILRHAQAPVQRELVVDPQYKSPLVSLLKTRPSAIRPGVTVPNPIIATALSQAHPASRHKLVSNLHRLRK